MAQKIRAIMILEIAGRPAEHVKQVLEAHVDSLGKVKEVKIIAKKISNTKKLDAVQEMYTCFAEVEIETERFQKILELVFDFMPSSIEIVEPANFNFSPQEATVFANDLAGRLHKYDEIAKIAQIRFQQMSAQMQNMQQQLNKNMVKEIKQEKPKAVKKKKKKN